MSSKTKTARAWNLASLNLQDASTDFLLSRQAMNCTPATMAFYQYTASGFLTWIENQGLTDPQQITARHVRQFLAELIASGRKDTTLHAYARVIRTLLRFWQAEGYIVLFMTDPGLRRGEVIKPNWSDIDFQSGLVRVQDGKKDRSAAIGAKTRRALLSYRRTLPDREGVLFQTDEGTRFTGSGLMMMFRRLSQRTGIHVTAHSLRRTFAILALRAGMNARHLQNLGLGKPGNGATLCTDGKQGFTPRA